ncbi:MAG: sulfur carrier protein ThiS [Caulobacteraceae bacterium]
MVLTVNGEERPFESGLSIAGLVAALGLDSRKIAVERNRVVEPKSRWNAARLADGDQIEIVHFVGGG